MSDILKVEKSAMELFSRGLITLINIRNLWPTLLLLSFTTGFTQVPDKAKLDEFFDRLSEKNKAMGSMVIAKDDRVIYTRSIGYSYIKRTEKKPVTAATKFRVGSVTKMFTAAMIFQLVEEGKLKLTDHLDKFFPQVPDAGKITIEHILAHRSGIREVTENPEFKTRRFSAVTKDEMVAFMTKSAPDFEPGSKYAYSSSGYFILGMIVEKLTGKSYQEALTQRITSRIGLKDTYNGTGNIDTGKNESFSYRYGRDWEQQPETHTSILFGSGALISTPSNLAKFIQALFDRKIVSKESLNKMMQDSLGMTTFTYHGKTFYGHTGGIDNFGSWLVYLPEEKLVLSYATNAKVYPVTNIIDGVFDIYFKKPFTIPTFETLAISTDLLDKYVGVYSSPEVPVKFTVTREGAKLLVQMPNQSVIPLEPIGEDKFKIESAPIEFRFNASKNEMLVIRSGRERVLTKEK